MKKVEGLAKEHIFITNRQITVVMTRGKGEMGTSIIVSTIKIKKKSPCCVAQGIEHGL